MFNIIDRRNYNNLSLRKLILFLILFTIFSPKDIFSQPLAHNKTKFVGNIIRSGNDIPANFDDYWNQVTAENAGKWGSAEPGQDSYNWTQLDNIYNYSLDHEFPYRHHNLIWGNQEPSWISGLDSAAQYDEIVEWISLVGERYPNADYCDVVNEPLHDPPSFKNALGGDGETGWDWVIKSFELAREYLSPNTELHLNEYSVINDNSANANFIEIINLLKERDLIDGIGVQGHHFEIDGGASTATLKSNLDNLAETGLPIYITELDINQENDNTQLQRYQTIFPVLYEHPGVEGITLWGYTQYETWRPYTYLITDRRVERPALEWLRTYLEAPFRPQLISPIGTIDEIRNPLMVWSLSDSATSYHIQISTNSTFSSVIIDSTVTDTLLQLEPLQANTVYYWHVSSINEHGESPFTTAATFTTGEGILNVEQIKGMPDEFILSQNYPNPFNPTTHIKYSVPQSGFISLKIHNLLGEEIAVLFEGYQNAGNYIVSFDGSGLASGVYLYQLKANDFTNTKKLILMK